MNTQKSNGMLGHADAIAALGSVFTDLPRGDVGAPVNEDVLGALGQVFRLPARAPLRAGTPTFNNRMFPGQMIPVGSCTPPARYDYRSNSCVCPQGMSWVPSAYGGRGGCLMTGFRPNVVPRSLYGDPFAWLGDSPGTLGQCATFEECFADPLCNDCWNSRWELCDPARGGDMGSYATVEECARARTRAECFPATCGTGTRQCDDSNATKDAQGNCVCRAGYVRIGGSGLATRCARQGAPAPRCPATCPGGQECVDPVFGCEPTCPTGYTRDPATRTCRPPSTASSGGGGGGGTAGIILLAVAAIAGIGLAIAGRGGA